MCKIVIVFAVLNRCSEEKTIVFLFGNVNIIVLVSRVAARFDIALEVFETKIDCIFWQARDLILDILATSSSP